MIHITLSDVIKTAVEETHKTGEPHTVIYLHTQKQWGWAPRKELFKEDGSPTDFLKKMSSVYITIYP